MASEGNSSSAPPARRSRAEELYGQFLSLKRTGNLNLGCGYNHEPNMLNLDKSHRTNPDILWNLEETPLWHPLLGRGELGCVFASHVFEHIQNIVPLMRELHKLLAPGGYVIAITPYATSDDAFEDPTHVRYFNERSWHYFNQATYQGDNAGHYDSGMDFSFEVIQTVLVPYEEFQHDTDIEFKRKHWRNVIREMHCVMRKV